MAINRDNQNGGSNFRIDPQNDIFSDRTDPYKGFRNSQAQKKYNKSYEQLSNKEKQVITDIVKKQQEELKAYKKIVEYQNASLSKKKEMIKAQAESLKKQIEERKLLAETIEDEDERRELIAKTAFLQDDLNRYLKQSVLIENELNRAYNNNVSAKEKQAAIEEKIKKYQEEEKKIIEKYNDDVAQLRLKYAEDSSKELQNQFRDELDTLKEAYEQKLQAANSDEEREIIERNHRKELKAAEEKHQAKIDRLVDERIKEDKRYQKLQREKDAELKEIEDERKKDGIDRFGNLNLIKAFKMDFEDGEEGLVGNVKNGLKEGIGSILSGGNLSSAFGAAVQSALPAISTALGPVISILSTISSFVKSMSSILDEGIQASLQDQDTYLGKMNSRLQGSEESYQNIQSVLNTTFKSSPFVSQRKALENIASLVEQGTTVNLEQRGVLMTLSDSMVSTFNMLDSTLTRMVRLQQTDVSAGQIGYEALLTQFLNKQFGDTSYLSDVYDNITASLIDAASQFDAKTASEFTYTVQKWLGSLYSVGMSSEGVSKIAQGINYLATGNVEALNSDDGLRNLFAVATQGSYSNILTGGLNVETVNTLLQNIVKYLQSIAGDTNQVTKQAMSGVFGGFSFSDLRSTINLTNESMNAIYKTANSYEDALTETAVQLMASITPIQNLDMSSGISAAMEDAWTGDIGTFKSKEEILEAKQLFEAASMDDYAAAAEIAQRGWSQEQNESTRLGIDVWFANAMERLSEYKNNPGAYSTASSNGYNGTKGILSSNDNTAYRRAYQGLYQTMVDNELYSWGSEYMSDLDTYSKYYRRNLVAKSNIPIISGISSFFQGVSELFNGGFKTLVNTLGNTFSNSFIGNETSNMLETFGLKVRDNGEVEVLSNKKMGIFDVVTRGNAGTLVGRPTNALTGLSSMTRLDYATAYDTTSSKDIPIADFASSVESTTSTVNSVVSNTISRDVTTLYSELFEKQSTAIKVSIRDIESAALYSLGSAISDNTKSSVAISNITDSALTALSDSMHVAKLDTIEEKISDSVNVNVNEDFVTTINNGLMYARSI